MLNISKIEFYRKKSGYTIDQLVEMIGITNTSYNNLKKTRGFRANSLEKMADIFGCEVVDFFDIKNKNRHINQNNLTFEPKIYEQKSQINLLNEDNSLYAEKNVIQYRKTIIEKLTKIIDILEKNNH
jgi:transcriptional regulator with XRE-family HTH domain